MKYFQPGRNNFYQVENISTINFNHKFMVEIFSTKLKFFLPFHPYFNHGSSLITLYWLVVRAKIKQKLDISFIHLTIYNKKVHKCFLGRLCGPSLNKCSIFKACCREDFKKIVWHLPKGTGGTGKNPHIVFQIKSVCWVKIGP